MSYRSALRPGLLQDRVILVTGGGSGIGRCTAHELAALGARVIVAGRRADKLARVCDEIASAGGRADAQVLDIREGEQVRAAVAALIARHGRIDGLVNNAGGQFPSPLRDISDKGWHAVVRNNLNGGFSMMREVYTQSMEAHGGAIVNVVACVDFGMPSMGHSGAARAGMINLTQTAALEWVHAGVRVNAVAPGSIATSGMATYDPEFQRRIKARRAHIPYRRMGTEAEVSAAICFLLSEAATYITGVVLPVDGGLRLAKHLYPVPEHQAIPAYDPFGRSELPDWLRDTPNGSE
ncbi:MAG: SDR family oxidoreductase [Pseudomonadota bacterium]